MKREIKPHKGGRTAIVKIRVTPEIKAWLKEQGNISDWIIEKVEKEMKFKTAYRTIRNGIEEENTFPVDLETWEKYGEPYASYFDEAGYPAPKDEAFTVIEYQDLQRPE